MWMNASSRTDRIPVHKGFVGGFHNLKACCSLPETQSSQTTSQLFWQLMLTRLLAARPRIPLHVQNELQKIWPTGTRNWITVVWLVQKECWYELQKIWKTGTTGTARWSAIVWLVWKECLGISAMVLDGKEGHMLEQLSRRKILKEGDRKHLLATIRRKNNSLRDW